MRAQTEAPGETAELLGAQVLALLPPLRLYSVSLFDAKGDNQWLSEGALGPDEQSVVEEATTTLGTATTRAHFEASLADNRAALFLAVRTPRAQLAGLVMLLMDAKTLTSGNLAARILTTNMRSVLQKIAMFLVPPPPLAATGIGTGIRAFSIGTQPLQVTSIPGTDIGDTANVAPAKDLSIPPVATTGDALVLEILEPEAVVVASPVSDEALVLTIQPEDLPATFTATEERNLRIRELVRLRPGARTRRFQVVPEAEQQRGDALATLNQLLVWLEQNPRVLNGEPLSFTIGVSAQGLADPALPAALAGALSNSTLDPTIIGYELRESACVTHRALAERFIAQCEQTRCFAVIDDFTFHTSVLDLLRSSAVKLLKVESRLVAAAMRDKLAQARVVAIAQAAKVLGTHCAAKYVDSVTGRRWLTAVGFDFTQASVAEPMARLTEEPLSA